MIKRRVGIGGIPILAKELAMNTVRDNTSRLGLGIGRMSKGDLKAFHATFVAADASLDGKVCKGTGSSGDNDSENCKTPTGTETNDKENSKNNLGYAYKGGGAKKIAEEAGPDIATSISKLSKGDLKAFHTTFKAADADLDKKVCKNGSGTDTNGEKAKKCEATTTTPAKDGGLEKVYEGVVTV